MTTLDETLAALSDPTRRGVIDRLRRRPHRAGELAEAFGVSPPAMSRHLRVLRASGLVEEEHQGEDARVRTYRLRHEPFTALRRWLDEVERYWSRELDAFKQHAERTRAAPGAERARAAPGAERARAAPGAERTRAAPAAERARGRGR